MKKQRLCSGFKVFPNGDKCEGCPDCDENIEFIYPELTESQKERKKRAELQVEEWVKGNSQHNYIDNECCPDFSCCKPEMLVDEVTRKMFKNGTEKQRESFMYTFLANAIAICAPGKKAFICNGKDEIAKELN